jgi:hypothetical protein
MHSSTRWTAAVAAIGTLALTSPARAQGRDTLQVGARYRITLPEFPDRPGPQFPQSRWLAGEFVAYRADSILVRPHPTTGAVAVPLGAIDRLERSRGVSRAASGFEGAVGGALVGALVGWLVYEVGARTMGDDTRWEAIGSTAAWSAAGGLAAGVLFPTERWKRISKPTDR